MAARLSGNALASINIAALRQASLLVTICEQVNHLGI